MHKLQLRLYVRVYDHCCRIAVGHLHTHQVKRMQAFCSLPASPFSLLLLKFLFHSCWEKCWVCASQTLSSRTSKQSMRRRLGLCSLCCSQGLIDWWKRALKSLALLLHVICVSQSRELQTSGPLQGPKTSSAPVFGTSQTGHALVQEEEDNARSGHSLKIKVSFFFFFFLTVFLHSIVLLMSHPHREAALLFSWSPSQHTGCNSLLCFCSLVLNR